MEYGINERYKQNLGRNLRKYGCMNTYLNMTKKITIEYGRKCLLNKLC